MNWWSIPTNTENRCQQISCIKNVWMRTYLCVIHTLLVNHDLPFPLQCNRWDSYYRNPEGRKSSKTIDSLKQHFLLLETWASCHEKLTYLQVCMDSHGVHSSVPSTWTDPPVCGPVTSHRRVVHLDAIPLWRREDPHLTVLSWTIRWDSPSGGTNGLRAMALVGCNTCCQGILWCCVIIWAFICLCKRNDVVQWYDAVQRFCSCIVPQCRRYGITTAWNQIKSEVDSET
jgi:hypothetical protein